MATDLACLVIRFTSSRQTRSAHESVLHGERRTGSIAAFHDRQLSAKNYLLIIELDAPNSAG